MHPNTTETPAALRLVQESLARAEREIPALSTLLSSFGPLLEERVRLRESAPGWTGPLPAVDPDRFAQGLFLLAHGDFQDMSGLLPGAAARVLPLLAASFPGLAGEIAALTEALSSGRLTPLALAEAGFGGGAPVEGVSEQTLYFVASELVRPFVERQARDLAALVQELPWRQTTCPVCGGVAAMSVLRRHSDPSEYIQAHGGRRFLRCATCSTEWPYKRVSCPGCGCEEPESLTVLRDPSRPYERADACTVCNTFLLCLDTAEMADIPDPDVAALTMIALESRAREQGFRPLAGRVSGL